MKIIIAVLIMSANMDYGFADDEYYDIKIMSVPKGTHPYSPCGGLSVLKIGDYMTWFKDAEVVATYRIDSSDDSGRSLPVCGQNTGGITTLNGNADPLNQIYTQYEFYSLFGIEAVHLDLYAPPVNVSIRTDNNDNFEAGSPRVLACIVYGCIPLLNVTWYLGDTMLRPNVYKEVNRGNYTVSSLTFVPSLTDNGKNLVCKVTNNLSCETFEDRVTISVGHRPMCVDDAFRTIGAVQGDSETLVCMVESDPEPEQFIWTFADGRTVYTSSKKVLGHENRYSSTLVWVPRKDDYGPLYCRGSNRFGEQKMPCTFSIIKGGPPTTPECDIYWEDQETLKVNCDKNWDGGRPQTIHLEVRTSEGTRKVSQEGNELKVNSLQRGSNLTLVLYATNSRGRSLSLQVAMPPTPPPANMPPGQTYPETSPWVSLINNSISTFFIVIAIISCCFYNSKSFRRFFCCSSGSSEDTEGNFHREEEMIEMEEQNNVPNESDGDVEAAKVNEPEVRSHGWQFSQKTPLRPELIPRREEFFV